MRIALFQIFPSLWGRKSPNGHSLLQLEVNTSLKYSLAWHTESPWSQLGCVLRRVLTWAFLTPRVTLRHTGRALRETGVEWA